MYSKPFSLRERKKTSQNPTSSKFSSFAKVMAHKIVLQTLKWH